MNNRLLAGVVLAMALLPVASAHAEDTGVAVIGDGSAGARALEERILLDEGLRAAAPGSAQVIWLLGDTLRSGELDRALARVRDGAGLVLVLGARRPELGALGLVATQERRERVALRIDARLGGPLARQVVWSTAPQAGRRWALRRDARSPLVPLVVTEGRERPEPVLLAGRLGAGRVAVIALQLTDPANRDLVLWPYFNYLLYALSAQVGGTHAVPFASWSSAPLPGARMGWILALIIGSAWLLTLGLFFRARRYSKRHPELLTSFFTAAASVRPSPTASRWGTIGFSRPLAGFLTLAGALFLLFAPFYWLTNILIPNEVQPFPQAKGIWDFAWEALQVAWFLFDAGSFEAFVKYFSEYRVKDPKESLRSAQFFVWWQIVTGLVQITFATVAAVVILPHTQYAYTSNFVILVALGQYPGFFGVVTFFFQAYQRFDYNIGLDLLSDWFLRFVLQIPFVLLFRAWGAANPRYGEAFGAAIGIGVGFHVSTLITFGVGVLLYRRLGLRLLPLFLVHFDGATARRMLKFGLKVVLGKVFFRAAQTIDRVVISLLLINYTEWLGLGSQIHYNLLFLFPIAYRFFETAMAALSEAHGNGKQRLTQYYVARFFQVGSLYSAIGLSLLVALGPLFVHGAMDPQWARAADYLVIAAVAAAFYAPAWLSDMLQKGAGWPALWAVTLGVEQLLRIGLFLVLIPRWQFHGYYASLLLTLSLKVFIGWFVNHRLIVRVRLYFWQMFAAPALAGLANFALLRLLAGQLPLDGRLAVVVFFFGAALLSFLVCFFACGLAGGFDRQLAVELDEASSMGGVLRPLTRLFYYCARAGWRLSPLHGRFPMRIADEALAEARELEAQRREVDARSGG